MKVETAVAWVDNHAQEIIERGVEFLQQTPEDSAIFIRVAKEAVGKMVGNSTDLDLTQFRSNFLEQYYRLLVIQRGPDPELRISMENGEPFAVITTFEMVAPMLLQEESKVVAA